jgi:hypothetical protein
MLVMNALLRWSSLFKVDLRGTMYDVTESRRRHLSRDRPSTIIFSFDGASIRRVQLKLLLFGGDRRGL